MALQTYAQDRLIEAGVTIPGAKVEGRNFWLYPFVIDEKDFAYEAMNKRGVDIYRGATQLRLIEPPQGHSYDYPAQSAKYMKKVMYFPIHRYVTRDDISKMVTVTRQVVGMTKKLKQLRSRLWVPFKYHSYIN